MLDGVNNQGVEESDALLGEGHRFKGIGTWRIVQVGGDDDCCAVTKRSIKQSILMTKGKREKERRREGEKERRTQILGRHFVDSRELRIIGHQFCQPEQKSLLWFLLFG